MTRRSGWLSRFGNGPYHRGIKRWRIPSSEARLAARCLAKLRRTSQPALRCPRLHSFFVGACHCGSLIRFPSIRTRRLGLTVGASALQKLRLNGHCVNAPKMEAGLDFLAELHECGQRVGGHTQMKSSDGFVLRETPDMQLL